ncbi:MAG: Ribose-5-phosphate isomerase A [Candidatus Anoxychlamydiales bacterium]|nr:Ribose-5-phosphate isomerase A [Candidatus Anoxychlamydiales bacterium]
MSLAKNNLAQSAANLVQNNTIVALGTGTTAAFFIEALAKRCEKNLTIQAVATSSDSYNLAKKLNITLVDINKITHIDIYIDGADEVDENKQMIKGKGAALLNEKILANFSKKRIIMIEDHKYTQKLGKALLPVEITPFAYEITKKELEKLGYSSTIRKDNNSNFFKTENQNYIFDIKLPHLLDEPKKHQDNILAIPGVVETGLFIDLCDSLIIASKDAEIEIIS